ncbi:transporter substrate-binding domain-containing protein [Antarcticimicrobium sediminis]|uniref:Amino acid ABC transporter substrate-binding protein n=1 Tax=Antarcticimicrobium sediminis TaxID=2546227 RepID=A0A4R5EJL8_9RHOB|nr:transporter substrate-binding domain-containing protein [Antarcticimicrobium sediminis]TDE34795.1 amino acid ABC transporter substrate-binding protein [Antarcticimicrobium sediminis]
MTPSTQDGWRVGVLFSRSGTTGVTETEHYNGTILAIDEINAAGGIHGRPIIPVCRDPKSDNDAYRKLARQMLSEDELDVIFGCSMSASRKTVLPVVERQNGLLFYPSMYEGFEYCENLIYTGATPNQLCLPLADYLLQTYGSRIAFVGSDYIYPRESNRIMRDLIEARGGETVAEHYLPLGVSATEEMALIREIEQIRPDAVFSTLVGTSAQAFYTLYDAAGIDRSVCPIASLTMAEGEIARIGPEKCSGHILAASYFQTLNTAVNRAFVAAYKARFGGAAVTSVWSEPAYNQVHLFARALERVGTMDTHRIGQEVLGLDFEAPGGRIHIDPETRHTWLTPRIGVARPDGLFDVVWESGAPVRPDPYLATTRFEEPSLREWA